MADKTVVVRLVARVGQFTQGMAQAAGGVQTFGNSVAASSMRASTAARQLAGVSLMAGQAVLIGVGAAMAVSAKAAIDFESSMIGVAKTVDASESQIRGLGEALREMALTTPMNVNELAKIAEVGGQLGVPITKMEKFTEVVAALGVTTNLSTEAAATGLARFANIMGTSFDDFERLGSILVDLGNNFAATESEILRFATRIAPIGAIVGATEEEVFGLAAAFTQLGVPAERGGTAVQRIFIEIEKAAAAGLLGLAGYAEVAGVAVEEFAERTRVEQFLGFIEGLGAIQDSGGSAVTALDDLNITSQRTIQVLLGAASAGDQFFKAIRQANEAGEESTALFEEAAKRYGSTASQIQLMYNAFTDLRIEIGNLLIPTIGSAITYLRDFFGGIKTNLPTVASFVKIMSAVFAGMLSLAIIGKIAAAIRTFATAAAAGRVGLALLKGGMIGLVTTAIAVIGIFARMTDSWRRTEQQARNVREAVAGFLSDLEGGVDPATSVEMRLGSALENAGVDVLEFRRELLDIGVTWDELTDALTSDRPFQQVSQIFDPIIEEFETVKAQINGIEQRFPRMGDVISEAIRTGRIPERISELGIPPSVLESFDYLMGRYNRLKEVEDVMKGIMTIYYEGGKAPPSISIGGRGFVGGFVQELEAQQAEQRTLALLQAWENYATNTGVWQQYLSDETRRNLGQQEMTLSQHVQYQMGLVDTETDLWGEFNDDMDRIFTETEQIFEDAWADIYSTIESSIDPFQPYRRAVALNAQAIKTSTDAQIADWQLWADTQEEIVDGTYGNISQSTLDWLSSQPIEVKAGLGALLAANETSGTDLLTYWEGLYGTDGRLVQLTDQVYNTELPRIGAEAMTHMTDEMRAVVEPLSEETGISTADLLSVGFTDRIADMPQDIRDILEPGFETHLGPAGLGALVRGYGENLPQSLYDGMLITSKKPLQLAAWIGDKIRDSWESILGPFNSPSEWAVGLGEGIADGLGVGLTRGLRRLEFDPGLLRARIDPLGFGGSIDNSRRVELNINNPRTNDLREDAQTALLLTQVAGGL